MSHRENIRTRRTDIGYIWASTDRDRVIHCSSPSVHVHRLSITIHT